MRLLVSLLCCVTFLCYASCSSLPIKNAAKQAHYFTKHLNNLDIEAARSDGLVNLHGDQFNWASLGDQKTNFDSYAGYFTVNEECDSNLYTWFFKNKNESAPVLLWLEGGPGASSLYGIFTENGPYQLDADLKLSLRKHAWTNDYSVLFVDSPVGAGFSYTGKNECYARNQTTVSNDLFNLLQQFFSTFPELKKNDFYITGSSYAGKYVPNLALKIHQNKEVADQYFNFVGVSIGNGLIDPFNQMESDELLYQIGLIDEQQKEEMHQLQEDVKKLITDEKWLDAAYKITMEFSVKLAAYTGLLSYYDFTRANQPPELFYWKKYIEQQNIRELLNVGDRPFSESDTVAKFLREDIAKPSKDQLTEIIQNNYKVLLYYGNLDLGLGSISAMNFLSRLDSWSGKDAYLKSTKKIWKVDEKDVEVAGYVKSVVSNEYKQFHYVTVRNAGHIATFDKPREIFDLLNRFINNRL